MACAVALEQKEKLRQRKIRFQAEEGLADWSQSCAASNLAVDAVHGTAELEPRAWVHSEAHVVHYTAACCVQEACIPVAFSSLPSFLEEINAALALSVLLPRSSICLTKTRKIYARRTRVYHPKRSLGSKGNHLLQKRKM
eukprot:1160640-Pelagomonas_calceolata.AAC.3